VSLAAGEEDRQGARALCSDDIVKPVQFSVQHLLLVEQNGNECLVLVGGRHLAFDSKPGQISRDLRLAHFLRVTLVVKIDITPDPLYVDLFSPKTVMPGADFHADTFELTGLLHMASMSCLLFSLGSVI